MFAIAQEALGFWTKIIASDLVALAQPTSGGRRRFTKSSEVEPHLCRPGCCEPRSAGACQPRPLEGGSPAISATADDSDHPLSTATGSKWREFFKVCSCASGLASKHSAWPPMGGCRPPLTACVTRRTLPAAAAEGLSTL